MKRTKNLNPSVIREAMSIAGGLYSMNASEARGYAFCKSAKNPKTICYGMFVHSCDFHRITKEHAEFEGYISYKDKTVLDIDSGETLSLETIQA